MNVDVDEDRTRALAGCDKHSDARKTLWKLKRAAALLFKEELNPKPPKKNGERDRVKGEEAGTDDGAAAGPRRGRALGGAGHGRHGVCGGLRKGVSGHRAAPLGRRPRRAVAETAGSDRRSSPCRAYAEVRSDARSFCFGPAIEPTQKHDTQVL